jgi:hypothetical protein
MKQIIMNAVPVAVLAALFWAITLLVPVSLHPGNPLAPKTPEQRARAEAQRKQNAYDQEVRRRWLDRVELGEASFAEAACVYERHKWWDEDTQECDEAFDARLPTRTN